MTPFKNEPFTDFSSEKNKSGMLAALALVKQQLGKTYPLLINGKEVLSKETFTSLNPANTKEIVGTFQEASEADAEAALTAATKAFKTWRYVAAPERAQYLFKMAELMRQRKFELAAWMIYEAGKNWAEADGDVAEAIDFLEYYGREMLRYNEPPTLTPHPTEQNRMVYVPLGVGAIIPPWNFPLAILAGMTMSAVVTGNTTVLKPSEFAPATGYQFMKLVKEVGLPNGVINFMTGRGATIGRYIVKHSNVRFISFTGSKKVGLEISEVAAQRSPKQKWMKRVVAEMGGKDAIIVDAEADIESAATGIVKSAFGFGGQKCSACSRAIIDEKVYDPIIEKVIEKTKNLIIGDPDNPETFLTPVVSQPAIDKAKKYIEIGKKEGKLLLGGDVDTSKGYFVKPTLFGDIQPDARLAQEEVFAPVLALIKSKNFDHGLEIANGTEYGLTGAFYTRNPDKIKKGMQEFHVGNLYVNRGCTGALVGAHPFGGFNMSGTDSKAGGPDYLLQFMQAKSISELKKPKGADLYVNT